MESWEWSETPQAVLVRNASGIEFRSSIYYAMFHVVEKSRYIVGCDFTRTKRLSFDIRNDELSETISIRPGGTESGSLRNEIYS